MYAIKSNPIFIEDRPKREFNDEDVKKYFQNGFNIFLARLNDLKELNRELTPTEQKEMKFMLEALIDAKNYLGCK